MSHAKAALEKASAYAKGLQARITIVAAQIVPYPLPLEKPPASTAVLENALTSLAAEQAVETAVEIYLCRDRWETLRQVLKPQSIVLLAGRKLRWWPSSEARFGNSLQREGFRVVFV